MLQWLEKRNWEEEQKEKFYFGKFAEKPLDWMRKNDKQNFAKIMQQRTSDEMIRRGEFKDDELKILKQKFKKEGDQYVEIWNQKVKEHNKTLRSDINYAM